MNQGSVSNSKFSLKARGQLYLATQIMSKHGGGLTGAQQKNYTEIIFGGWLTEMLNYQEQFD